MSEPGDAVPDKATPALQPAPVGKHGHSGEGAASVLRALRENAGHKGGPAPDRDRPDRDATSDAPGSSRDTARQPRA